MSQMGYHDFAGSGVVHLFGGMAALAGSASVGSRMGRWEPTMQAEFVPHNIPSVIGGTLILFVGWFGFNPGSTLGLASPDQRKAAATAAMVTALAASATATIVILTSLISSRGTRLDILGLSNGLLAGLVAITGGCDVIDGPGAIVTGVIAAFVYKGAVKLRTHLRVDDVVDAFAVHGANGLWGCIATGLFHRHKGLFTTGNGALLGYQITGCLFLAALALVPTLIVSLALRRAGWLRITYEQEIIGLDAEFGLTAYVEKSLVLRRCEGAAILLREKGYSAEDVLNVLKELRDIIYRPFTPQAADNKLEGEILDIMQHLDISGDVTDGLHHLAFLSHHKADAGDAARIFVDTAKRLLETSVCERIRNSNLVKGLPSEDIIFLDSTGLKARRHCCHCYCDYYCGAYGGCLCCDAEGAPCTARQAAGVHASRHPEDPVLIAPIAAAHAPVSDTRLAPSRRICPSSSKTWSPPPTTS